MGRKAVLIGCNYPGTSAALEGCCNDVDIMCDVLQRYKGFDESDITILKDDGSCSDELIPTGANIRKCLTKLCTEAEEDDVIFIHFSGHGTQVPADDDDPEDDRKDEAICPTDMSLIVDDDLRAIVSAIPEGCRLTLVTDCCHSGSMLDHTEVAIEGDKDGNSNVSLLRESASLMSLLTGGTREVGGAEVKNRALPITDVASLLGQITGRSVQPGNIRSTLGEFFGGDAGRLALQYFMKSGKGGSGMSGGSGLAAMAGMLAASQGNKTSSSGGGSSGLASLAGSLLGGKKPSQSSGGGGSAALMGLAGSLLGGKKPQESSHSSGGGSGLSAAMGMMSMLSGSGDGASSAASPSSSHSLGGKLSEDKGVLITGCQAHETSADVRPPGGKAFGALTNSIQTVLKTNPDASYYDVVSGARTVLSQAKHAQNPCLECSEKNSRLPFIC
uniref:Caspase-like protein n=1 Tax=Pyropia haitanensis TaxID=1262161 RepID=A0A0Y0ITA6_PYRHA|nr:caspase-like protein [Neoporphyra haitanensis]